MGLFYTYGCLNFRDFGGYINLVLGKDMLPVGKLYRGGSIDPVEDHAEIEHAGTIINLRKCADVKKFDADYYHFPMADKPEKYDTTRKEVVAWLNEIMRIFERQDLRYPVLIHCLAGIDRTGIAVAGLLSVLGVDTEAIVKEYLLSDGGVNPDRIRQAIRGMSDVSSYFSGIDMEKIRMNILNNNSLP